MRIIRMNNNQLPTKQQHCLHDSICINKSLSVSKIITFVDSWKTQIMSDTLVSNYYK